VVVVTLVVVEDVELVVDDVVEEVDVVVDGMDVVEEVELVVVDDKVVVVVDVEVVVVGTDVVVVVVVVCDDDVVSSAPCMSTAALAAESMSAAESRKTLRAVIGSRVKRMYHNEVRLMACDAGNDGVVGVDAAGRGSDVSQRYTCGTVSS